MIDKAKVKKILVINLSNIGDAVLTTPVIQALRDNFPQAHLAVLVGPRAFCVFKTDPRIDQKIIYDKSISWKNKLALISRLRQERYDLVVDLRNTALSILLGARYCTSPLAKPPKSLVHMKDRHLWRLKCSGLKINDGGFPFFVFSEDEEEYINQLLSRQGIKDGQGLVAVACGARNLTKRWEKEGYRQLIEGLIRECNVKIVMVGDEADRGLADDIIAQIKPQPLNICGQTSIGELAFLLTKCRLLVANDSCPMHVAWAVDTAVVALFGPTDHKKYAPRGPKHLVIHKELACSPCERSLCPQGTRQCMKLITASEVFAACKKILNSETSPSTAPFDRLRAALRTGTEQSRSTRNQSTETRS